MASEAITRNDLTAILNEVLPPTPSEYKKLLWTNPSPSATFAAQTISLDLSDYDEIEVEYSDLNDASHSDKMPQIKARVGEQGLMGATFGSAGADYGSGSIYNVTRRFAIGLSGITFDGGHGATASGSYSARNDVCVPLRIYGIQYDYVAPPQAEIADYIVEQGTSGIWTYRKWNSGIAELWASASQTVTAYASNLFIVGSETVTPYPFAITSPKAQAYCVRLSSGLGIISYDYNRTDYWSAVCCSVNQSIAQGQSREIVYNLYIMAKWK